MTCDQQLDIVIGPDHRWRWKDEDHLARTVDLGWVTPAEARAMRREGEAVIAAMERGEPPFGEGWPQWRADLDWAPPELPPTWRTTPPFD